MAETLPPKVQALMSIAVPLTSIEVYRSLTISRQLWPVVEQVLYEQLHVFIDMVWPCTVDERAYITFQPKTLLHCVERSERIANLVREYGYGVTIGSYTASKPRHHQGSERMHTTTLKRVLAFLRVIRPLDLEIRINGAYTSSIARAITAIDASRVVFLDYKDLVYGEEPSTERRLALPKLLKQCSDTLGDFAYEKIHPMNEAVLTDVEVADLLPASFPVLCEMRCATWPMYDWDYRLRPEGGQRRLRLTKAVLERAPNVISFESGRVRCGYDPSESDVSSEDPVASVCGLTQRFLRRHVALQDASCDKPSKLASLSLDSIETEWPPIIGEPHPIKTFPELRQLTSVTGMHIQSLMEPDLVDLPPNLETLSLGKFESYKDADGCDNTPSLDSLLALLAEGSSWMPRLELLLIGHESDVRRAGALDRLHQLCDERKLELDIERREGDKEDGSD